MTGGYAGDSSDDCTATKSQVLEGCKAITKDSDDDAELGTMPNKGAWTNRIGVNGKAIIPAGYHNGSGYVDQAIANRGAWGTSIGINGNITIPEGYHNGQGHVTQSIATMGGQTITPSASQQTVACNGKYMTGNVIVNGVSNLSAANIKRGSTVGGVAGTCDWAIPMVDMLQTQTIIPDVCTLSEFKDYKGKAKYSIYDFHTGDPCISLKVDVWGINELNGAEIRFRVINKGEWRYSGYGVTETGNVVKILFDRDKNGILSLYCCATKSTSLNIRVYCLGVLNVKIN